jgi:hypothetical protein
LSFKRISLIRDEFEFSEYRLALKANEVLERLDVGGEELSVVLLVVRTNWFGGRTTIGV